MTDLLQDYQEYLKKMDGLDTTAKPAHNKAALDLYRSKGPKLEKEFSKLFQQIARTIPKDEKVNLLCIDPQVAFTAEFGGLPITPGDKNKDNGLMAEVSAAAVLNAAYNQMKGYFGFRKFFVTTTQDAHRYNPKSGAADSEAIRTAYPETGEQLLAKEVHELSAYNPAQGSFGPHAIAGYDAGFSEFLLNAINKFNAMKLAKHFGKRVFSAFASGLELNDIDVGNPKYRNEDMPIYTNNGETFQAHYEKAGYNRILAFGVCYEKGYCVGSAILDLAKAGYRVELLDSATRCLDNEMDSSKRKDLGANRNDAILEFVKAGIAVHVSDDPALQSIPESPIEGKPLIAAHLSVKYNAFFDLLRSCDAYDESVEKTLRDHLVNYIQENCNKQSFQVNLASYFEKDIKPMLATKGINDRIILESFLQAFNAILSVLTAGGLNYVRGRGMFDLFATNNMLVKKEMRGIQSELNRDDSAVSDMQNAV